MCKKVIICKDLTFGAELKNLKKATEEAVVLKCYSRSFGVKVTKPTITHEDSMSIVANYTKIGSVWQNKIVALSRCCVREYCYGDTVETRKIDSDKNGSNALTKGLDSSAFNNCDMIVISS